MSIIVSYFSMLVFFIFAEMIVLTNIMQPLFKKHIGFLMKEDTNFSIAAIFYLIYVAGVFWFATRAGIKSESYFAAVIFRCIFRIIGYLVLMK